MYFDISPGGARAESAHLELLKGHVASPSQYSQICALSLNPCNMMHVVGSVRKSIPKSKEELISLEKIIKIDLHIIMLKGFVHLRKAKSASF